VSEHNYIVIEAISEVASYRIPEYHNYHKTLPLPPPTTIIGMVGAALGYSAAQAQSLFDETNPEIGIYGCFDGIFKDLWKYSSTKKGTESSILQREYLYNNVYCFVIGADYEITFMIKEALNNCKYPITAGNSDSLMKLVNCQILDDSNIIKTNEVEHCMIIGDYRKNLSISLDNLEPNKVYVFKAVFAPVTYNLPMAFNYDNYGIRQIRSRKDITFVHTRCELNDTELLKALNYREKKIPLFNYNESI